MEPLIRRTFGAKLAEFVTRDGNSNQQYLIVIVYRF